MDTQASHPDAVIMTPEEFNSGFDDMSLHEAYRLELLDWYDTPGASEISNCIEVAALPQGGVQVRDSKDRGGQTLTYSDQEWRSFIAAIKRGDLEPRP